MELEIYTRSRDMLYEARGIYKDGYVTVKKGSTINIHVGDKFRPSAEVKNKRDDTSLVDDRGTLLADIKFTTLSTAASFVTGRSANGMLVWKTMNGKYIRDTLKPKEQ